MALEFFSFDRKRLEDMSDFVIKTGTKEIKCHKFKLAQHSEVFHKMFQHDLNENRKNEVLIDDFGEETVEDFVDFLYQGELAEKAKYTIQLLYIGHRYQVKALVDACSDYLQAHLTKENVAETWVASETFEISKLIEAVNEFLAENWTSMGGCYGIDDVIEDHPEYMVSLAQTMNEATRRASTALEQKAREYDVKQHQEAEKDRQLAEKDCLLAEKDRLLAEKDRQLAAKDSDLRTYQRFIRCHAQGHKIIKCKPLYTNMYTFLPCEACCDSAFTFTWH